MPGYFLAYQQSWKSGPHSASFTRLLDGSSPKFHRRLCRRAIRHERERLGLQQEKFAEHASVHGTYISSVELGKVNVGIEVANALTKALEMRLSELIRLAE